VSDQNCDADVSVILLGVFMDEEEGRSLYFHPLVMTALRSRCEHYIFALWFVSSIFFPRLTSAVAEWIFTILIHMVWP